MTSTLGNYSCHRSGIIIVADQRDIVLNGVQQVDNFLDHIVGFLNINALSGARI